jgi:uncharacterized protein (DUF697 family)
MTSGAHFISIESMIAAREPLNLALQIDLQALCVQIFFKLSNAYGAIVKNRGSQ